MAESAEDRKLRELAPRDELGVIMREATQTVEDQLALEDVGWINLGSTTSDAISGQARIVNLKLSRLYSVKDPLGKQSIRLWTDYTFGTGMVWSVNEDNEQTKKVLEAFWNAPENKSVLSNRGQRKSSDKLLIDGEVFFCIFLGAQGKATIRFVDPLEIAEIITNPEDKDEVQFYRRTWSDPQGNPHDTVYRSPANLANKPSVDMYSKGVSATDDGIIYHLTYNTTTERGNPLLLPALDWIKQYRRFLASRIAVILALARFAWRTKVKGGQAQVDAIKGQTHGKEIPAGSDILENLGSDTTPIKTESGATAAYRDGKMLLHQVCAAVGISEQYFGDISTGNLATAKTVELPMKKMFESYQSIWDGAYQDIDEIVLAHNKVPPDKWYVDRDFPEIDEDDVAAFAKAIMDTVTTFPEFGESSDVQQVALLNIGVDDPAKVLETLAKEAKKNPTTQLLKAVKAFREAIEKRGVD